jgi:arginase
MSRIRTIGVPLDLGASRRGVDMGPSALRIAQLCERLRAMGHELDDAGNLEVARREDLTARGRSRSYFSAIVDVCRILAAETESAVNDGFIPLSLGGDHSLAAGSVAGVASAFHSRGERIGLIWLDAHADLHTPQSSETGNIHGMPLAHLLGHGDRELASISRATPAVLSRNVALVGIRDLDPSERQHVQDYGVSAFTMREIDERGLKSVMLEALSIALDGTAALHLSCDLDWLDPSEAPGVGTPVPGGATFREGHLAMELISDSGMLAGIDLVENNPTLDERNVTAELSVDLVRSVFGRKIL